MAAVTWLVGQRGSHRAHRRAERRPPDRSRGNAHPCSSRLRTRVARAGTATARPPRSRSTRHRRRTRRPDVPRRRSPPSDPLRRPEPRWRRTACACTGRPRRPCRAPPRRAGRLVPGSPTRERSPRRTRGAHRSRTTVWGSPVRPPARRPRARRRRARAQEQGWRRTVRTEQRMIRTASCARRQRAPRRTSSCSRVSPGSGMSSARRSSKTTEHGPPDASRSSSPLHSSSRHVPSGLVSTRIDRKRPRLEQKQGQRGGVVSDPTLAAGGDAPAERDERALERARESGRQLDREMQPVRAGEVTQLPALQPHLLVDPDRHCPHPYVPVGREAEKRLLTDELRRDIEP